jgi:enoyl-CoA hydratase/carnithine racemase
MTQYPLLQVERKDSTAILQLSRPERLNALSMELLGSVADALVEADHDDAVRVVIVTGSEKAFSTGADLNEALEAATVKDSLRYLQNLKRTLTIIETLSKPVVAAIRGYCVTGGLELAMACDLRFAGESSKFAVTSSKIGSVAGMGGTQRLPRLVGPSRAKDILLSARYVDAEEAYRIGLVDRLVADDTVLEEAMSWAAACAERAPISVWLAKWGVTSGVNMDLNSALDFEWLLTTIAFNTEDKKEGMQSVLEKRRPNFQGK